MTCRDLITSALEEIKAYAAGETPSGEDAALGLDRLQKISDTYLGTASTTLTLDSTVPALYGEGLLYELAFRLCGPFGGAFTQEQHMLRRRAKSRMLSILDTPADAVPEEALIHLQENRWFNDISFNTGS